ncbi:hypothetical protein N7490_010921 [Penicillium lividum]|nr:hypothetical protein N7490_010921 [Penicillium lividum]
MPTASVKTSAKSLLLNRQRCFGAPCAPKPDDIREHPRPRGGSLSNNITIAPSDLLVLQGDTLPLLRVLWTLGQRVIVPFTSGQ